MYEIIVNPVAGRGLAKRTAQRVEQRLQELGIAYESRESQGPGHATELAREAVGRGTKRVLSVGGDGTAYEVVNGLKGTETALGILPAGTGNDFARVFQMPKDPMRVLERLLEAPPCPVNVCTVNDGIFLNVSGAGFDVDVLRAMERARWMGNGMLPYLYGVLYTVFHHKPLRVRLRLDGGEERREELLLIAIANGQYIGGGMRVAPMARLDDDLMDVILVKTTTKRRILSLLPSFISGKFLRATDIVSHVRCRTVEMEGEDLYVQTDGLVRPMSHVRMGIAPERQLILLSEEMQRAAGLAGYRKEEEDLPPGRDAKAP